MKVREIERLIKDKGWYVISQRGSHKYFKHSTIPGKITVPQHKGDLHPDTAMSILKQAKIKERK